MRRIDAAVVRRTLLGPSLESLAALGHAQHPTLDAPAANICFSLASGRMDDLLVAVEARAKQAPVLHALSARRWMKPLPLNGVAYVSTLQRLDDARWLLGGRLVGGGGFATIYSP